MATMHWGILILHFVKDVGMKTLGLDKLYKQMEDQGDRLKGMPFV